MNTGQVGWYAPEGTSKLRVGLGIPAFQLAHASIKPDEQDLLFLVLENLTDCG